MNCSHCGGLVVWAGPLTDLTHTECMGCGAVNAQAPADATIEEGGPCPMPGCTGTLEIGPVENCSCHISPPCSACVSNPLTCTECGMEVDA